MEKKHTTIIPITSGYRIISSDYLNGDKELPIFEMQERGWIRFWRWKTFLRWIVDANGNITTLDKDNNPLKKSVNGKMVDLQ